ncbi:MAG: hypothetical protein ACI84K_000329, partial [Pseudohongiellaceae bacterium]
MKYSLVCVAYFYAAQTKIVLMVQVLSAFTI